MGRVCKERLETSWLGTGLGTRSREVERLNMWNPSNPCMHGQRTLNDNDDDDDGETQLGKTRPGCGHQLIAAGP